MVTNVWSFQLLHSQCSLLHFYLLINSLNSSFINFLGCKSPCGGSIADPCQLICTPVLVWSTVHHYVTVDNPGGIQLLLMPSQKVNDEVLKNVGTPHLSCMPHAEVVSVCTGRLKNRRGRDGRSGVLRGGH